MPFCIYNIKSAKWAMLIVWYIFIHIPHRIYYFSYHWHTYSIFICCSYRAYKLHFVWAGTPYSNNCCYWRSCFGWWPRVGSFMRSPHMWCCLYLEHYQISTFLWDNYFLVFWIFKCIPTLLCAGENAVLGMPETGLAIIPGYVIM